MRTMTALMMTLAAGAALADDDAGKKDMLALEGEWVMVSGEQNGKKVDDETAKSARRVTRDGMTTLSFAGTVAFKAKISVDTSKKPKTIDYLVTDGPSKGKTVPGIYELDGDTVKYCFAQPDNERPKEFTAKEGSNLTLSVWKREKK